MSKIFKLLSVQSVSMKTFGQQPVRYLQPFGFSLIVETYLYCFEETLCFVLSFIGHVDPGENEYETAVRETQEEAGLTEGDYDVHKECQSVLNYEVNGRPKRVIYWLAKLKENARTVQLSDEHQDYKWLTLEDAMKYAHYKDLQNTLHDCHNYIQSHS